MCCATLQVIAMQRENSSAAPAAYATDDCPVCLKPLNDQYCLVYHDNETCRHAFCEACVQKGLSSNHLQCPMCRANVTSFFSVRKGGQPHRHSHHHGRCHKVLHTIEDAEPHFRFNIHIKTGAWTQCGDAGCDVM